MSMLLRDVRSTDLDSVLALNNAAGPTIVPIDGARLRRLESQARYFRVAEMDGHLAGFLIGLSEDADYDSPNFQWFKNEYTEFFYIDRVVVASSYRRHGIGRVLYADALSFAEVRRPNMTTEVFLEPRDDAAMLFFSTQGFMEVGQQTLASGRRVCMMQKDLKTTYDFVQQMYGQNADAAELFGDRLQTNATLRRSA
jgi:uncharacterized protein